MPESVANGEGGEEGQRERGGLLWGNVMASNEMETLEMAQEN